MANDAAIVVTKIRQHIIDHHAPLAYKELLLEVDTSLLDSGIIDSMGFFDLISFLEKEFKIKISDEDLLPDNFESIASLAVFVQTKRNGHFAL